MKRITSIGLLLLFLSAQTEICQLLKIPELLGHYSEHKKRNSSISIFEFISDHYGSELNHSDTEHQNLPFKSNDCGLVHASIAYYNEFQFNFTTLVQTKIKAPAPYSESGPIYSVHNSIWQPPKLV